MITYLGFRNFFSFKEGAEIDFRLDRRVLDSVPNHNGVSYLMGIKGGNASGKTNIIRAIGFLANFISESGKQVIGKKIQADQFFDSKEPSEFIIEFNVNDVDYKYELIVDRNMVHKESLSKKVKRETLVFERDFSVVTKCLKTMDEVKKIKLKDNASLIGLVEIYNFSSNVSDLKIVFDYFNNYLCNVGYAGLSEEFFFSDKQAISKFYYENENVKELTADFLKLIDPSIVDFKVLTDDDGKSGSGESESIRYFPMFIHKHNDKVHDLTIHDESNGVKALYNHLCSYWFSIATGGVIAIDEFDIHLHAMILPKILELFELPEVNKKNAQFIFTAHNTEIMDYLGKYRTVLVDKNNAESYCYKLDEMPSDVIPNTILRGDRKISGLYMKKKLGGVPLV